MPLKCGKRESEREMFFAFLSPLHEILEFKKLYKQLFSLIFFLINYFEMRYSLALITFLFSVWHNMRKMKIKFIVIKPFLLQEIKKFLIRKFY